MNLVVGATGLLGMEICRLLRARGEPVRGMARLSSDPGKIRALNDLGVETIEGDLKQADSLERACGGVNAVISTASSTLSRQQGDTIESVDRDGQIALVDAAAESGVAQFVYISFRDNPSIQFPLTRAKRAVESRLKQSRLAFTSLQASWFMEVWLSPALGFDAANRKATVYGSGKAGISWVSYRDVAQLAVATLYESRAHNRVLEVGGPQALSPVEVIQVFENAGFGKFTVDFVSEQELQKQFAAAEDSLQQTFAGLMLQYASGDAIDMSATLEILPIQLTTVQEFASRMLRG